MLFRPPRDDVTAVVLSLGEPTTQDAMESVRRQTLPVANIIVIRDTIPSHKALNAGAERVTTPFFVQVDSDMILDPHCVRTLRRAMRPKVGVAVGHLRDALTEQVVGIKLFRTECFAIATLRDSICPDTDFVDEIARAGWQTTYVGQHASAWTTLGEHRPNYAPDYTYRKYLMEGQRYRHRGDVSGLRGHFGRLEQSRHPSAFVAQIGLARGFFRDMNRDALGLMQGNDEFALLEAFLHANKTVHSGMAAELYSAELTGHDRFHVYFRIGNAAFDANDPVTFRRYMSVLSSAAESPAAWISKLALCQGLLATRYGETTNDVDYQRLSAFIAANQDRVNVALLGASGSADQAAEHNSNEFLSAVMGRAADGGLQRFVVAPAFGAEYVTERPAGNASYRTTTAEVSSFTDHNGRPRIRIPFRLFGHIVCSETECMTGIFWCFDLLKAGYLFAYIPTNLGLHRVLLPRLLAQNVLKRLGWHPASLLRSSTILSAAFAGIAKSRKPRYRPEPDRVLIVTTSLSRGGSERQMVGTISELLHRGYDVKVLTLDRLEPGVPSFAEEMVRLGVVIEFVAESGGPTRPNMRSPLDTSCSVDCAVLPGWFVKGIAAISATIERHRPAVVHCWMDHAGVLGALAGSSLGAPRIVVRLGSTVTKVGRNVEKVELWRHAYRALVRNPAVRILNNSKVGARDYEEWLGVPSGTIAVLYNGFIPNSARTPHPDENARLRASLGLWGGAAVVGTVMRFTPEKDPDLWLDTAAEIAKSRPDVRFLIGGYGALKRDIIQRIKSLGIGGQVVLAGPVIDAGLFYSVMDVVLLTSAREGLPNVMIEAQAAGRPVVATDVGGTREALVEGRTGAIVRQRSATALAKTVVTMLDDVELRARVRTEGPKFVASRFGLDRMVDETLGHYGFVPASRG